MGWPIDAAVLVQSGGLALAAGIAGVQTPGASAYYGITYYSNAVNLGNLNSAVTQAIVGGLGPVGPAIEAYYGIYQGLCGK